MRSDNALSATRVVLWAIALAMQLCGAIVLGHTAGVEYAEIGCLAEHSHQLGQWAHGGWLESVWQVDRLCDDGSMEYVSGNWRVRLYWHGHEWSPDAVERLSKLAMWDGWLIVPISAADRQTAPAFVGTAVHRGQDVERKLVEGGVLVSGGQVKGDAP